jgi:VHL beta domain
VTGDYVNLDWLDFNGNKDDPKNQQTIAPNTSLSVSTYLGHAWVVSNAHTGKVIRTVIVKKDMMNVRVR